jgi:glucose/arabinose dehydrogenase
MHARGIRRSRFVAGLTALLAGAVASAAATPQVPAGFLDEPIVTGLHGSACMTFLPDGRVLATQQPNFRVILVDPGPPGTTSVVGTVDSVQLVSEGGLLGIAVDPRWPVKPYLYFHTTFSGGPQIHVTRYAVTGDLDGTGNGIMILDSLSRYRVVDAPNTWANHNGGQLHFGPDDMLYVSLGDDGADCQAQETEILRGKILRLDVLDLPDGPGGPPPLADITPADNPFIAHPDPRAGLVWALGLRNPYSFSIDPPTGHVVIADVGAAVAEEIDLATTGGLNFGWPMYEGFVPNIECPGADTMGVSPEKPIYTYGRPTGVPDPSVAVISGGLYRAVPQGSASFPPEYEGNIFLGESTQGFLRRLTFNGASWQVADSVPGQPSAEDWGRDYDGVTSYAVGPDGALWYAKYAERYSSRTGEIRRIRWVGTASTPRDAGAGLRLDRPVPSPAREHAALAWTQPRESVVTLDAFDVTGARVRRIVARVRFGAGRHAASWDLADERGARVAPGVYFVTLAVDTGERSTRRLVVLE